MKILILTQNLLYPDVVTTGLEMAKSYASTIGLNFDYTYQPTNKKFSSYKFENDAVGNAVAVRAEDILGEVHGSYKVACLIFDWTKIFPQPTNPVQIPISFDGCTSIQVPCQWFQTYPEVLCDYFLHELCHSGYYFKNDIQHDLTHAQHSFPEWTNKQAHEYYLYLLQGLKQYLDPQVPSDPILRLKSTNKDAVRALQTLLGATVDGDFGPKTLQAVITFQKSKGLTPDGIVGTLTWDALRKKKQ